MAADKQKLAAITACYYFLDMQSNYLLQNVSFMKPFISSKVELIMSAQRERNKANRCKNYVELVVPSYTLDEFRQHYRLKRGTFEILINYMGNLPEFSNIATPTCGRPKIPLDKMILMTLWYLGNQESLRGISDRFGVPKSSVYTCTRKACSAIAMHLMEKFIRWPTLNNDSLLQVRQGFESGLPLPGCIGCIDSTHIAIKAPKEQEQAYVNRKGFHSVILQGVCTHERKFSDIFCGCVGSTHDATVLRSSPLYHEICQNIIKYFPDETYIIGDQAYPLESWLLKKYQDTGKLSENQQRFNKRLSSKRQLIEQTFAILKGRFRKLKMLDIDIVSDIPQIVAAACTLHNICMENESDLEMFLEYDDCDVSGQQALFTGAASGSVARDNVLRLIS